MAMARHAFRFLSKSGEQVLHGEDLVALIGVDIRCASNLDPCGEESIYAC